MQSNRTELNSKWASEWRNERANETIKWQIDFCHWNLCCRCKWKFNVKMQLSHFINQTFESNWNIRNAFSLQFAVLKKRANERKVVGDAAKWAYAFACKRVEKKNGWRTHDLSMAVRNLLRAHYAKRFSTKKAHFKNCLFAVCKSTFDGRRPLVVSFVLSIYVLR